MLARPRSEWAVGMAGAWCSLRVASRSCRVSRREAQRQNQTEATQRRDGLCVCVCDAPKGTESLSCGSVIVLSIPRPFRGPTCAGSMKYSNNSLANHTFDNTSGRVLAGGVLVVDGANRHPRPRRLHGRSLRDTHMVARGRWQARLAIRSMSAPSPERVV